MSMVRRTTPERGLLPAYRNECWAPVLCRVRAGLFESCYDSPR
jgi:hypothetical protein